MSLPGLSGGDYTLGLRASDAFGNVATDYYSWAVDLAAPTARIEGRPPEVTNSSVARFVFGCSDGLGSCGYQYAVTSPGLGSGALSWQTLPLPALAAKLDITDTVVSLVTAVHTMGGENFMVTSNVSVAVGTTTRLASMVQFEYVSCPSSCAVSQLSLWTKMGPGESILDLQLPDGPHELRVRVSGVSKLGDNHPSSITRFTVRAAEPQTVIRSLRHDSSHSYLEVELGLGCPGEGGCICTALHYSLDGGPWTKSANSSLRLAVRFELAPSKAPPPTPRPLFLPPRAFGWDRTHYSWWQRMSWGGWAVAPKRFAGSPLAPLVPPLLNWRSSWCKSHRARMLVWRLPLWWQGSPAGSMCGGSMAGNGCYPPPSPSSSSLFSVMFWNPSLPP